MTSLRRSIRRATSSRYRNRSASLRQSTRSYDGGALLPTTTSGNAETADTTVEQPPPPPPTVPKNDNRTLFPVRKNAIRPGSFSMNKLSPDLDDNFNRKQMRHSMYAPKSRGMETTKDDDSEVAKTLTALSPTLTKSMSFRDPGSPKPLLKRNLSFVPDPDELLNRSSLRVSKVSGVVDVPQIDNVDSDYPRKFSNGSQKVVIGEVKTSPTSLRSVSDAEKEIGGTEMRNSRSENASPTPPSRRTSLEKKSHYLRKSSLENNTTPENKKSQLKSSYKEVVEENSKEGNAELSRLYEARRTDFRKRSISENEACHLSNIQENTTNSSSPVAGGTSGWSRPNVMQKRSVSLEEKRETSQFLSTVGNRRSFISEPGNDLRRSVLRKNTPIMDSSNSFHDQNTPPTTVMNVNGNLVAMSSPQVIYNCHVFMRL